MRLIFAVFHLPFWVFMIVAAGLFGLAELSHRDTLAQNRELAKALAGPPPETVSLSAFSRDRNMGPAREISVQAVINPEYNYELTKTRKGMNKTRYMFVLFDASDPVEARVARGAMVLTEAEKDKFINDYYLEHADIAFDGTGAVSVVTLNGRAERSPDLSSLVSDAFDEKNLSKSDDFIYIKPFLDGRVAGLTPTMTANQMRDIIRGIGLFALMIGLIKFARRRKLGAAAPQEDLDAPAMGSSFMPQAEMPRETRFAPEAPVLPEQTADEAQGIAADTPGDTEKSRRKLPFKALALIALAGAAVYTGHFVYLAIGAVILLQIVAVRKTRGLITGALARFGIGASKDAKPEGAPAHDPEPEAQSEPESAVAQMLSDAVETKPKSRRFSLSLPAFGRKAKDTPQEAPAEHAGSDRNATRQPQAVVASGPAEERIGLGEKLQVMLARLTPAAREPKAFAGRPDPFERLAAQAQQSKVQ